MENSLLRLRYSNKVFGNRAIIVLVLFGLVTVGCSKLCLAQLSAYRPDNVWTVGGYQTTQTFFGMSELSFTDAQVSVNDLDSIGNFTFRSANVQWHHPSFSLLGNAHQLSRGFSDSLLSLLSFDTDPFRREEIQNGSFGAQAILPIDDITLAYLGETIYLGDFDTPIWFVTPGFATAFLHIDSLISGSSNPQKKPSFFTDTGDSLARRVFGHVPNPSGGWWGVSKSSTSNRIHSWHINADTVLLSEAQNVGKAGIYGEALGLSFRPSGDAFALVGSDYGIDLFFFDRITGIISLWSEIDNSYDPDYEPFTVFSKCEWSPNGRYLYVTNERKIYQFDTEAADIASSAIQLNEPENLPYIGSYLQIERGPDCRLYIARAGTSVYLSVIDKPNRAGKACELKDGGLKLPNFYVSGIPDFPEYSLWAKDRVARGLAPIIDTAVCDSSIQAYDYYDWTTSTTELLVEAEELVISPNPVRSGSVLSLKYKLTSSLLSELNTPLTASLFSIDGKQVGNLEILSIGEEEASVQLPTNVPKGLYRLLITNATRPLLDGKVLVR